MQAAVGHGDIDPGAIVNGAGDVSVLVHVIPQSAADDAPVGLAGIQVTLRYREIQVGIIVGRTDELAAHRDLQRVIRGANPVIVGLIMYALERERQIAGGADIHRAAGIGIHQADVIGQRQGDVVRFQPACRDASSSVDVVVDDLHRQIAAGGDIAQGVCVWVTALPVHIIRQVHVARVDAGAIPRAVDPHGQRRGSRAHLRRVGDHQVRGLEHLARRLAQVARRAVPDGLKGDGIHVAAQIQRAAGGAVHLHRAAHVVDQRHGSVAGVVDDQVDAVGARHVADHVFTEDLADDVRGLQLAGVDGVGVSGLGHRGLL